MSERERNERITPGYSKASQSFAFATSRMVEAGTRAGGARVPASVAGGWSSRD